jgi:hypothetical protein
VIKRTRFSRASRGSLKRLIDRCDYSADADHPNHVGKIIHRPTTAGCDGITVDDFLTKILDLYQAYEKGRAGKKGNRTTKLFEEFVYSCPIGTFLSPAERKTVNGGLRQRLWNNVPILPVWHEDPVSGRSDLHVLAGAYTDSDPPLVFTSAGFGHGAKNILLEMERAEDEVLQLLNQRRARERWILSARETRRLALIKAGKKTLVQRLAKIWDGKGKTLQDALLKLGYFVLKLTAKTVTVARNAAARPRRYLIATLEKGRMAELKALSKEGPTSPDPEMGGP